MISQAVPIPPAARLTWPINVGDITAPTITSSATTLVNERTVNPTGTFTADETVTWTLRSGGDTALFALLGDAWTLGATLDYEGGKQSYVGNFRATDYAGNFADWVLTVNVADLDEIPTAFATPAAETAAALSTQYTRTLGAVSGLGSGIDVPLSIAGGRYRKNGGSWTTAATTIINDDTIDLEKTTGSAYSTATPVTLTYGGLSLVWNVTTLADVSSAGLAFGTAPPYVTRGYSSDLFSFAGVAFPTGRPVVLVFSNNSPIDTMVLRPSSGGDITLTRTATQDISTNGRLEVWEGPGPVAGASYEVRIDPATGADKLLIVPAALTNAGAISSTATKAFGYSGQTDNVTTSPLTISTGGLGIAMVFSPAAGGSFTWNNGSEVADLNMGGDEYCGVARYNATTTPSVNLGSGGNGSVMLAVAWSAA